MNKATVNATIAPNRINVAVLLAATSLFTPNFSQTGIKIRAPPIARVDPINPAQNPTKIKYQALSLLTFIFFLFI
ncbi:MAG: hypothetical protein E6Q89_08160 [Bacteroidia bacterium]|nr:MAG: hypothetical protein E6Q89_08160 [Bacteroidia bacterium]